jgi:hypothetical protein
MPTAHAYLRAVSAWRNGALPITHELICLNQQFCLKGPASQTPAAMKC